MSARRFDESFIRAHFDVQPVGFLGSGGFGEVWRVRSEDGDLVLKLLERDAPERRWWREVDAHRIVRSSRIPPMADAGTIDDGNGVVRWILLRFVDGPNVRSQIKAKAWPTPSELSKFARGVLQAVRDVHAAGLIFRDVSPGNIVLESGRWDRPHLVDLGLVVPIDAPAQARSKRAGTRAYKAPEQLRKIPVTPATDLFGVGVVCYKLAAQGAHPFLEKGERLSTEDADARIQEGPRPLSTEHAFNEPWLKRLLSHDPGKRWASTGRDR